MIAVMSYPLSDKFYPAGYRQETLKEKLDQISKFNEQDQINELELSVENP